MYPLNTDSFKLKQLVLIDFKVAENTVYCNFVLFVHLAIFMCTFSWVYIYMLHGIFFNSCILVPHVSLHLLIVKLLNCFIFVINAAINILLLLGLLSEDKFKVMGLIGQRRWTFYLLTADFPKC